MNRSIWLALALTILAAGCGIQGPLQVGTSSLPDAAVQQTYVAQLRAIGGGVPLTWSLASGTLPPGVSLSTDTGVLSGAPSAVGEFNFSVRVTANTAPPISALSRPLRINVRKASEATDLRIITTSLASGSDKTSYDTTLSAAGGTTPYTWSVASGALPPGVTLSSSAGTLSGTPTSLGSFSFTVGVQDSSHPMEHATQALSISVGSSVSPLGITTTSLPSGTVQSTYSTALIASGGTAPYSWSLASGSLPPGLALSSSTGALSGTPTAAGTFSFTVGVADSSSQHATRVLSVSVAATAPSLRITTSSLPSGAVQVAYSAVLAATGGSTPYSWSVGGILPAGLTLSSSTGAITGTPTQAGSFSFTAQVKDSTGATASAGLNASIAPPSSPVVNGISPQSGATSGGTTVTISGSNFASGATVLFGGTAAASVKVSSANQVQAVTPAHIAGTVDVSLAQNGQTATLSSSFTYNAVTPTVTGVSPDSGPTAGGTTVTIRGSNFLAGALVLFGTVSAPTVTVGSGSQIQAITPPNATGLVDVTVENPGNLAGKLAGAFTYETTSGPPTITSVSPTSGAPGAQVTITGTNFVSADTVSFGGSSASSSFVSTTELLAVVPNLTPGTYGITVTDPDPASVTFNGFNVTSPPPTQSLLSGCTVNNSNQPNCTIPSGWSLVTADNGTNSSSSVYVNPPLSRVSTFGHLPGTTSYGGYITGDGTNPYIHYHNLGSFSQIYVSYWEYQDSNAMYANSDNYLVSLIEPSATTCGPQGQSIGINAQASDSFPDPASRLNTYFMPSPIVGNPGPSNCQGYINYAEGAKVNVDAGVWRQYEFLIVPGTSAGPGGNSASPPVCTSPIASLCGNGTLIMYVNGVQTVTALNANLNGTQVMDLSDAVIEVGGVVTSFSSSDGSLRCPIWSMTGGGSCPGTQPGTGAPQPYNRYITDIIIMKK